jgi:D-alanyl-lipoteichoic acid acyltransferase DltB (MBOAT superfamily)
MYFIPIYILILLFTIVIDYIAGIMIEKATTKKKLYLIMSIVANVGVLAFFKYFNFLNENLRELAHFLHWNYPIQNLAIILPIGLSFHTFQAMSYTIEVYRGNQKAERHFGIYALYVMFYPQLVAGPIERPQNVLHQFHEKKYFNYDMVKSGLLQIGWGLLKKCVVADRLAQYVNPVFDNPQHYHGYHLIIAVIFFAFQIYCDFSGYSDIALGSARVMGFKLMTNFNFPYSGNNLGTFWRRWHISLSTWFNDYLFTPFITKYRHWGIIGIVLGVILTFSVSGLWHGAAWTFIIWGMLHGVGLSYELLTSKFRKKMFKKYSFLTILPIGMIMTFSFVCITYIFFRSKGLSNAWYFFTHLFQGVGFTHIIHAKNQGKELFNSVIGQKEFYNCIIGIVVLCFLEYLQRQNNIISIFYDKKRTPLIRWSIYYLMIMLFLIAGVFEHNSSFIYFQF